MKLVSHGYLTTFDALNWTCFALGAILISLAVCLNWWPGWIFAGAWIGSLHFVEKGKGPHVQMVFTAKLADIHGGIPVSAVVTSLRVDGVRFIGPPPEWSARWRAPPTIDEATYRALRRGAEHVVAEHGGGGAQPCPDPECEQLAVLHPVNECGVCKKIAEKRL